MTDLKLTDERAPYMTTSPNLAEEIKEEGAGPGKGVKLAQALEAARLQTEVADLRERNSELWDRLKQKEAWSQIWKRAARVNRRAINDFAQFGPPCPKCSTRALAPIKTICRCLHCRAQVQISKDVKVIEPSSESSQLDRKAD